VGILSSATKEAKQQLCRTSSHQIRQPGRCAGQGLFPDDDVELVNFVAIVTNQALWGRLRSNLRALPGNKAKRRRTRQLRILESLPGVRE
jgi:hypothetical protein